VGFAPTGERRPVTAHTRPDLGRSVRSRCGCTFSPAAAMDPRPLTRVGVSRLEERATTCRLLPNRHPRLSLHHPKNQKLGSPIVGVGTHADQHLAFSQSRQRNTLRFEVSSDVFCMPAEDYINFGMLLQFFERICPRRVQEPIPRLRFVDLSRYQ
jgi:hypothetical protein